LTALTRSQALTAAAQIRDETATGANTATRVGTLLSNLIDSTVFVGEAQTPPTAGNGLTGTNVFSVVADGTSLTVSATGVKITDITGPAFLGRAANSSGAVVAIAGTANQVPRVSSDGTTLAFGTIATAGLTDAAVTMPKLANLAGPAVIGRAAGTSGVPAAITATVAGQPLIYDGTSLAFGNPDFAALSPTTTAGFVANSATGFIRLGLAAGSGAGVASAASVGHIRGPRGTFRSAGGTGLSITGRRGDDLADVDLFGWDSTAASVGIGGTGVTNVDLFASSTWRLRNAAGTTIHAFSATSFNGSLSTYRINNTTGSDSAWSYEATASATGFSWSFAGQNAATTGGNMTFSPGTGGTAGGFLDFRNSALTSRLKINDTGIGFFAATPVVQQTLTDNTTGTAATQLVDVGAVFSQANLNNNFASIRRVLNRYGLAA